MKYLLAAAILFFMQNPSVTDSISEYNTPLTSALEAFSIETVEEYSNESIYYTVSIKTIFHEAFADDGTLVATHHYEYPQIQPVRENGTIIHAPNNKSEEHALLVCENFNNYFMEYRDYYSDFNGPAYELDHEAKDFYDYTKNGSDSTFHNFYKEIKYSDIYQTDHIISLYGHFQSYTGGAKPFHSSLGFNYDLKNGCFFSAEILGGSKLNKAVAAEIIRQANLYNEDAFDWQDFVQDTVVKNWSDCLVTLNEYGMVVTLPYLFMGEPTFHLSYEFLEPHLSNRGKLLLGLYDTHTEQKNSQ